MTSSPIGPLTPKGPGEIGPTPGGQPSAEKLTAAQATTRSEAAKEVLSSAGFTVFSCDRGDTVVDEMVAEHQPDVIVLDIYSVQSNGSRNSADFDFINCS